MTLINHDVIPNVPGKMNTVTNNHLVCGDYHWKNIDAVINIIVVVLGLCEMTSA